MRDVEKSVMMFLRHKTSAFVPARIPDASESVLRELLRKGYIESKSTGRAVGYLLTDKGKNFVDKRLDEMG